MKSLPPGHFPLVVAANGRFQKRVGEWVEAGEVVGRSPGPGLQGDVRSPVSGIVAAITPLVRSEILVVVERRREYEEMEH
jgi:predicted deacylase